MVQGIVGGEAVIGNRKPCILVHQTANSILSFVHFGLQLEKIEIEDYFILPNDQNRDNCLSIPFTINPHRRKWKAMQSPRF